MSEIYSILNDFPRGLKSSQLQSEITASMGICVKIIRIDVLGDVVTIIFFNQISPSEKIILNGIVAAHTPKPNDPPEVKVSEESTKTGENFQICTMSMDPVANTTTSKTVSWPYPISGLLMGFISEETHRGDIINLTANEDMVIGTTTTNISPVSAWSAQNYTAGQIVSYNTGDPVFGTRIYTCIMNTVSNEVPTNTLYWKHGYRLVVSASASSATMIGQHIKISDGVNTNSLGRIVDVSKPNNWIYLESAPVNSFIAPSNILLTVYAIIGYEIGAPGRYLIGDGKIGGAYMPADTKLMLHYTNNSVSTNKHFVGFIELLY